MHKCEERKVRVRSRLPDLPELRDNPAEKNRRRQAGQFHIARAFHQGGQEHNKGDHHETYEGELFHYRREE